MSSFKSDMVPLLANKLWKKTCWNIKSESTVLILYTIGLFITFQSSVNSILMLQLVYFYWLSHCVFRLKVILVIINCLFELHKPLILEIMGEIFQSSQNASPYFLYYQCYGNLERIRGPLNKKFRKPVDLLTYYNWLTCCHHNGRFFYWLLRK